jgi:hypothetical protein
LERNVVVLGIDVANLGHVIRVFRLDEVISNLAFNSRRENKKIADVSSFLQSYL